LSQWPKGKWTRKQNLQSNEACDCSPFARPASFAQLAIDAYTPPLAVETIPSPFYSRADILPLTMDRFAPILLKKAKIERLPKSRESRCLDVSAAAMLARGDTKIRRRFCERRCGPSHRGERNASAVLKNFVRQPEKTFSTVSANSGQSQIRRYGCLHFTRRTDIDHSLVEVSVGPQADL
jgi:hypothetical protein